MAARKGRGMAKHNSDGEAQVLAEKLRNSQKDPLKFKRLKVRFGSVCCIELSKVRFSSTCVTVLDLALFTPS